MERGKIQSRNQVLSKQILFYFRVTTIYTTDPNIKSITNFIPHGNLPLQKPSMSCSGPHLFNRSH